MEKKKGFSRYPLHERILEQLPVLGFNRPTKVQERVIPLFIQKRNMIVEAPTGTGKTAAYGFPLISQLNLLKRSTQALVLVPSRELALQVSSALQSYFNGEQLHIGAVYGGTSMAESCEAIKSSPHILVAVPGRLKDVMAQYQYDFLWRDIKFLIIDEGDKMLEIGFQKDFDDIRANIRKSAQICFLSATISEDSELMIRERIRHIQTIRLAPREMLKNIRFAYVRVPEGQREPYLEALLKKKNIKKALIFTGKRDDIYSLIGFLRNNNYRAEGYFGAQNQTERKNILQRFKEGYIDFLVASDLAARGLDIPDLPAVINLSIPEEFDYYLHRIGRTGRAGNKGWVYNLVLGNIEKAYMKNHHQRIGLSILPIDIQPLVSTKPNSTKRNKWIKFHFSRGKKDKIRKGDIVGFLLNHASDLKPDEIGTITVFEQYAIVDLPLRVYAQLQENTAPLKIKGKSVKIRKYKIEEQAKRAKSVKKLLKDRR